MIQHLQGDCREVMKTLPAESVHCCVTSPPYFGLRDYGFEDQIGLEESPEQYVANLVEVFRQLGRVLRSDGTAWLNLGDSYASNRSSGTQGLRGQRHADVPAEMGNGLKSKDLIGIPWRVALALQADGWYLRSDIIWHKPNVMPESVKDRPTKAHEYIFLLSKSDSYFYDADAIKEPLVAHSDVAYRQQLRKGRDYSCKRPYKSNLPASFDLTGKNKRSVWSVPTSPFTGAHFAVFPPELIRPCILAGCPAGGTVIDPFGGSGTTGLVAEQEGRNAILIELNPEYVALQKQRTQQASLLTLQKRASKTSEKFPC